MSIRVRKWGDGKTAYVVAYRAGDRDEHGKLKQTIKTFKRKNDAREFEASVRVDISNGTYVPPGKKTVAEAGELWLKQCKTDGLEQASIDAYRSHFDMHIKPFLGRLKLSALTADVIKDWRNKLLSGTPAPGETEGDGNTLPGTKRSRFRYRKKRSPDMVRRVTRSLGTLLADAVESKWVARNAVHDFNRNRKRDRGNKRKREGSQSRKLVVGTHIPTTEEVNAIIAAAAEGRDKALLLVAIRCGLRASELRGLEWSAVDLKKGRLHVQQRADRYNELGPTKSETSERTMPIPPTTVAALREWKLKCPLTVRRDKHGEPVKDAHGEPIKELRYVFPNGAGNIESHSNIVHRVLEPTLIAAGVTKHAKDRGGKPLYDEEGKPVLAAKYTGLHALRHFFASWCANRKADGGRELPIKIVSERLGHSSIALTANLYTHLFPSGDEAAELAAAEGPHG